MTLPVDQIICDSALTVLADFPADSIDCIVTSPPYWGLRDYGVEGQLGLESHPQEYLEKLWAIFDECRRVLKPTGCCFVNMGDTYFGGAPVEQPKDAKGVKRPIWNTPADGNWLKPKNLLMIPERFAIGMQERSWWLRNKIVWHKPNAMPSSVKDRFSCTWEYVWFFTKSARYWFDLDAVREPQQIPEDTGRKRTEEAGRGGGYVNYHASKERILNPLGKNPGDCWIIPTCPFPEAHFAVYPPELIRKPIRAGCPAKVCVECGKPWERVVETEGNYQDAPGRTHGDPNTQAGVLRHDLEARAGRIGEGMPRKTVGWQPTCKCGAETEPGIALDPFFGAGTTGVVAIQEGRHYIGIDLSEEYCEMARKRLANVQAPLFAGDS